VTQPRIEPVLSRLSEQEPASVPILRVLGRRGILHARSGETGQSVTEFLGTILATPRAAGMDSRDIYWGLLERLYNPLTNTQIVNVCFRDGELDAQTSRVYALAPASLDIGDGTGAELASPAELGYRKPLLHTQVGDRLAQVRRDERQVAVRSGPRAGRTARPLRVQDFPEALGG